MKELQELQALIDEKLVGYKIDHVQAQNLIATLKAKLQLLEQTKDKENGI
jgi:hypothetical protein